MTRRFPVGPRPGHHAVQRPAAARGAQARAGPRRRLPLHHPAGVEDAAVGALAGRDRGRGRRADGRRQRHPLLHRARRGAWCATSASALSFTGSGEVGWHLRRVAAHAPRDAGARRQRRGHRARGRRRRLRRQALRVRRLPARRAGLHLGAAPVRARVDRRGLRGRVRGADRGAWRSATRSTTTRSIGCLVDGAAPPTPRWRSSTRRARRAPGSLSGGTRLAPTQVAPTLLADVPTDLRGLRQRGLRAHRGDRDVRRRGRRDRCGREHRLRPAGGHLHERSRIVERAYSANWRSGALSSTT